MKLELLAPARNKDIGIAAIDCGADAIYIAGPSFGAREAAGNSVEDIAELVRHARPYGVKVFTTVNTLVRPEERREVLAMLNELHEAGVDAFILQDLTLLSEELPPVELHASTQTVIRTPEQARLLESLGFSRLILERQLSLDQVRAIREAVSCELEFFVHGALCVSYSGQCYLSEQLTGRSANRGCCAQPCRSRYDLTDAEGKVILRDRSILSLKDYRLDDHIADLAGAGICSFKIEGRLKNASYVKNTVRHYRSVIDSLIEADDRYCRASAGRVTGGFSPELDATFNRGFTSCFIDGRRGEWNSRDAARSLGEMIGTVASVSGNTMTIRTSKSIANGDGLSFTDKADNVEGMRVQRVDGDKVTFRNCSGIRTGMKVYRNLNVRFEHELEHNMPRRLIDATVSCITREGRTTVSATAGNGLKASFTFEEKGQKAEKGDAALESLRRQLSKVTPPYSFTVETVDCDCAWFHPVSEINTIRRTLASMLDDQAARRKPSPVPHVPRVAQNELTHLGVQKELMRSKYCIRYELGICPKMNKAAKYVEPLYLVNTNYKLRLHFDCKNCEMVVSL